MISVIPFTAQPHSWNTTEKQRLGCEDRNRQLGLRRKRWGISQGSGFAQPNAPPNQEGSGPRTRATTRSTGRFTFSVLLPRDTNLLISGRPPPGPKSHRIHYHPQPFALPSSRRHQTLAHGALAPFCTFRFSSFIALTLPHFKTRVYPPL